MWKISPEAIISEFKDIRGIAAKRRDARSVRPCTILTIRMLSRTHEPCVPTLGVIQHLSMLLVIPAIPAGHAATLSCRQSACGFRWVAVVAGPRPSVGKEGASHLNESLCRKNRRWPIGPRRFLYCSWRLVMNGLRREGHQGAP